MGLMDYFRPGPTIKSASGADLVSARQAIVSLAQHSESQNIRQAALSHIRANLSDEKKYAIEYQLKSLDLGTRFIGEATLSKFDPTECIQDQAFLFDVAKNASSKKDRHKAINQLTSQLDLVDIAINAIGMNEEDGIIALPRIEDQDLLYKVACGAKANDVWRKAIGLIKDQKILRRLARKGDFDVKRALATERLADQKMLIKIALNDRDPFVRRAALRRIDNEAILKKAARKDNDADNRKYVLEKKAKKLKHKNQVMDYARVYFNNLPITSTQKPLSENSVRKGTLSEVVMMLDSLGIFSKSDDEDPREAWRNISPGHRDVYYEREADYAWFVLNVKNYMNNGWVYDDISRIIIKRISNDEFAWYQETITKDSN